MNSCLYEGHVVHARKRPVAHKFGFKTFFFYLDLDELDQVFEGRWLYSSTRPAFARFRFDDHLMHNRNINDKLQMRAEVLSILEQHGVNEPIGPIRLLTQLRYLGFVMNPVNFFYCFDATGERVTAIVAEVNNTPWGEQHLYVIKNEELTHSVESEETISANNVAKEFHVSPFMPLDMTYDFNFGCSKQALSIRIANFERTRAMLNVTMSLQRRDWSAHRLRVALLKYPLISWKVFGGIYWQALRLFIKRVPFYPHPSKGDPKPEPI